uniref:G_PROTEIN_RECEP_F1_2 domain-containing protein n=1 Tax=Parastrongyloides trichosuri TaxID=131310 RepID=A0A0N4Z6P7_PARTI
MVFGGIGTIINIFLILFLITSEYFRVARKLVLFLALGDWCNCLYVFMQGYERKEIYLFGMIYGYVKNQTYWTCALMAFDWLGLLGSLIPHMVTFIMGIERLLAIKYPVFYNKYLRDGEKKALAFCFLYVIINIILAFTLAYIHRYVPSRYYCGRKVSYTKYYTSFIYGMNVFGYVSCFLMTFGVMLYLKVLLRSDSKV